MGNRLSGSLAIICMDRFEQSHVYNLDPKLPIYVRYVDDTGSTVPSVTQANALLKHLNDKHPTIKFELELPDTERFLPILDIKLKIREDGTIEHKLYRKAANKGLTLHFKSNHPISVKRAVVQNELPRAERRMHAAEQRASFETHYGTLETERLPEGVDQIN